MACPCGLRHGLASVAAAAAFWRVRAGGGAAGLGYDGGEVVRRWRRYAILLLV